MARARAGFDIASTLPGTPGGAFMRQFWIAVARSDEVKSGEAKPVRIMGEDFTLYRGESGKAYMVDAHCPHRFALMHLGWIEGEDIRCVYHGWKFDCTGQCVEQPAEEKGFARKVKIRSVECREYIGLIYAYFGAGKPPAFPPFPVRDTVGVYECWNVERVPCNYLQSYENSMDEVHVAFTHAPGGSHAPLAVDLPEVSSEETDWGLLRLGTRRNGKVRVSLHYAPNVTRVIVPPRAGMGDVGWREIYFNFTPVDDDNHLWLIAGHTELSGEAAEEYLRRKKDYEAMVAKERPARDIALDLISGKGVYSQTRHPDLAVIQDIATQAGQGVRVNREGERLGKSDAAIIHWRKILNRELAAISAGKKPKRWKVAPKDIVPTLGF